MGQSVPASPLPLFNPGRMSRAEIDEPDFPAGHPPHPSTPCQRLASSGMTRSGRRALRGHARAPLFVGERENAAFLHGALHEAVALCQFRNAWARNVSRLCSVAANQSDAILSRTPQSLTLTRRHSRALWQDLPCVPEHATESPMKKPVACAVVTCGTDRSSANCPSITEPQSTDVHIARVLAYCRRARGPGADEPHPHAR